MTENYDGITYVLTPSDKRKILPGTVEELKAQAAAEIDARAPDRYEIEGYEVLEKSATAFGSSAHVIVPRGWVGGRVKIVRLD